MNINRRTKKPIVNKEIRENVVTNIKTPQEFHFNRRRNNKRPVSNASENRICKSGEGNYRRKKLN